MKISILSLTEGAKQAEGITVIIDVFRAFTLEAYLFAKGAAKIYAVGSEEEARKMKEEHPEYLLIGERYGRKLPGFDFGNSPDAVRSLSFFGRTFVHTTTNGTQGIANAVHADQILTGSLVNARATAEYIKQQAPEAVSLVAMGWDGHPTEEDELCAQYLKSLLEDAPMTDIAGKADALRFSEGKKFFDPSQQDVFPEGDFELCVRPDCFHFVIEVKKEDGHAVCRKKDIHA
jgi:2-phosphosulfolactate phosphatase